VILTLWRGDHVLGELRTLAVSPRDRPPRIDRRPTLSAVLIPVESADLRGVWQVVSPILALGGVQQYPVEPDIVAEREQRFATGQANPGPVALQPMSPEVARGVPPAVQLTVRDAQGRIYLPREIFLQEIRHERAQYDIALGDVPAEALIDGSVWSAFVAFTSAADAPAP
jgi:hypothetical protein